MMCTCVLVCVLSKLDHISPPLCTVSDLQGGSEGLQKLKPGQHKHKRKHCAHGQLAVNGKSAANDQLTHHWVSDHQLLGVCLPWQLYCWQGLGNLGRCRLQLQDQCSTCGCATLAAIAGRLHHPSVWTSAEACSSMLLLCRRAHWCCALG